MQGFPWGKNMSEVEVTGARLPSAYWKGDGYKARR